MGIRMSRNDPAHARRDKWVDVCVFETGNGTGAETGAGDVRREYLANPVDFYSTQKQYLDLFCEKSGTSMQFVQKWMPIVAASQSVKGNEKEREFLLSWANVAEYH